MNLRTRTLGIFLAALLALGAFVYVTSSTIISDRFSNVEDAEASKDLDRAHQALNVEVTRLNSVAADWGPWTDTYNFVRGEDDEYIDVNLMDDTLTSLRIDMMLFYDADGALYFGKEVDQEAEEEIPLDPEVTSAFAATPGVVDPADVEQSISGLVQTSSGKTLLMASSPISTSDETAPVTGSIVVARWIDEAFIEEISDTTRLSVETFAVTGKEQPDVAVLAPGEESLERVDSDHLIASTVLTDVTGQPAIGLSVNLPRPVYAEGQDTVRIVLVWLLLICLVFGVVSIALLETSVIRPVRGLSRFVSNVKNNLSSRAPHPGKDEVGQLALAVNEMLDSLQESSDKLTAANTQLTRERETIEELNHSLEAKVAERTDDLERANAELRERNRQLMDARTQAATDGLTGLGNHRAFHEAIRAAARAMQDKSLFAVLMVDIDNFKMINDKMGHQTGDRILVLMGHALRDAVEGGMVFRYGGDEFAVITSVDSMDNAQQVAEHVRVSVADGLREMDISVSVGIAVQMDTDLSPEEIIYQADSAMYRAKAEGKNRARVWAPGTTITGVI